MGGWGGSGGSLTREGGRGEGDRGVSGIAGWRGEWVEGEGEWGEGGYLDQFCHFGRIMVLYF